MKTRAITVRLLDRISGFVGMTAGVASFIIAVLVAYSVIAREIFHSSESGIADISTYLMAYITFVGAAYALWEGGHVGVNLLTGHLHGRARAAVTGMANLLLTAVATVFAWLGFAFWQDAWSSGERAWGTLSIPLWIPYASLFVGALLFLVVQIARIAVGKLEFTHPGHERE
jgi:TRAP-type C4-dicarboxylate transport system permease small subunit